MKLNIYGNQPIIAPRDPVLPMEAATKNYVDFNLGTHQSDVGLHLNQTDRDLLDGLTVDSTALNNLQGVTGPIQPQLDSKVKKSGDTMTGPLTLPGSPINALEAAPKQYVDQLDEAKLNKSGGVMTGQIFLVGDPTSNLHASSKRYVDDSVLLHANNEDLHLTTAQNALLDGVTVTHTEINRLSGVTGNVQSQLNYKVSKAGDTMTGPLVIDGAPVANGEVTNKKYVDDKDALKVSKAGDLMTGPLVLSGEPTQALEATTKKYVDDSFTTHKADKSLHLTVDQNLWIDAITVTSDEVNHLSGTNENIALALQSKFDKTGGNVSGDITLGAGKTVYVSKVPVDQTELVNKEYVDAKLKGLEWKDPVSEIDLISDNLSAPPSGGFIGDTFIVADAATGAWLGMEGHAMQLQKTGWVSILNRPVQIKDRFGVKFQSVTPVTGGLVGEEGTIVTITDNTVGAITYASVPLTPGATTLVFDPDASNFGTSFSLTDELTWVATNTSANLTPGEGLVLDGNLLNYKLGDGLVVIADHLVPDINTTTGIDIVGGKIALKAADATIELSSSGAKVGAGVIANVADRVSKTTPTDVTATITVKSGNTVKVEDAPVAGVDATNKTYVDGLNTTMGGRVDTLETTVGNLATDAVTKKYVDDQDAFKVSKTGDTMSGPLVIAVAPVANGEVTNKQYVDTKVSTHASDDALHVTPTQNTFLDGITVSSTEVNQLEGVTSSVQDQINTKVNKAGDILTGQLTSVGAPVADLHLANKKYADDGDALSVKKTGDTMTGALVLSGNPTTSTEASNKGYVDSEITSHSGDTNLHISASERILLSGLTVGSTEINELAGITSNVQTQLDSKLAKTGGTLTGPLTLSGAPTEVAHAATKKYVDDADALAVKKSGDTMTGALVLPADPITAMEASNKQYVDSSITTLTTHVDTQDLLKLNKAGGTLTGPLILNAAPVAALEASTKQYVDSGLSTLQGQIEGDAATLGGRVTTLETNVGVLMTDPVTKEYVDTQDVLKLDKVGGTMTGHIVLHANPVQDLHPATKQYVDAIAQGLAVKPSIRLATLTPLAVSYNNGTSGVNSTLTGTSNGKLVVDGKDALVGDRILVMKQVDKAQNGDYVVQQVGDAGTPFILKRVTTADESSEVPGSYFYVYGGDTLKGTGWVFTVDNPITYTIGTDEIHVNQFSGQGNIIAGSGLTLNGNTINLNAVNSNRIVVNGDDIDLAVTGVIPASYTKVTVDGYGRITTGVNPTTLQGFGITDAQPLADNLTSISNMVTNGIVIRNDAGSLVTKEVTTEGVGLSVTNGTGSGSGNIVVKSNATSSPTPETQVARDALGNVEFNQVTAALVGNASTATKLKTPRDVSITGDVVATAVAFDGSAPVELSTTLTTTGITAGTYTKVTLDDKGRATAGTNPTTVGGYGITDAATIARLEAEVTQLRNEMSELYSYVMSRM